MKRWVLGAGFGAAAIAAACVGDDSSNRQQWIGRWWLVVVVEQLTSSSSGTLPGQRNRRWRVPVKPLARRRRSPTTLTDAGATTKIEQVRVVGTAAFYARTDTGSAPTYIFESDFALGSPPTLNNSKNVVDPHVGESDLAPTVASDGSFIVFTHNEIGSRILWSANAGGAGFYGRRLTWGQHRTDG